MQTLASVAIGDLPVVVRFLLQSTTDQDALDVSKLKLNIIHFLCANWSDMERLHARF